MKIPWLTNWLGRRLPPGQVTTGQATHSPQAAAVLRELLQALPEVLLAAVLDAGSGELLAAYTTEADWQPAPLAAPLLASVQVLQAALPHYGEPAATVHDVVWAIGQQLHLLLPAPTAGFVLYLAISEHDTNLALARQAAQQALQQLFIGD